MKPIESIIAHPSALRQACAEHVIRELPRALRPAGFGRRYPVAAPVLPPINKCGVTPRAW